MVQTQSNIHQSSEHQCTLTFRRDFWENSRPLDFEIVDSENLKNRLNGEGIWTQPKYSRN